MKKHLLIAAGFTLLISGFAVAPDRAQASWAETPQGNPVHTGTNRSLWRSERAQRHFSYGSRRYWNPGYSAYGAYQGGGYYGGGYYGRGYDGGYFGY
jgi:hypothetical protein